MTTKPIYSGLFVQGIDENAMAALVDNAIAGGASGVSIFSADGMDAEKWNTLGRVMKSRKQGNHNPEHSQESL